MIPIFERAVPELSMISKDVADWMYATHGHKETQRNHSILNPASLRGYSGFIDDTDLTTD